MGTLIIIILILAIAVIYGIISTAKDYKSVSNLKEALNRSGYFITENVDVRDINNDTKPFSFMIDRKNRKWFLADFRANSATAYDFSDLENYVVTIRTAGNSLIKGDERKIDILQNINSMDRGIICQLNLEKNICEYIAISVTYGGRASNDYLCNNFVLYEKQDSGNVKNWDYISSSACIADAKKFEGWLFEIVKANVSE